jgi:hypothetical protein
VPRYRGGIAATANRPPNRHANRRCRDLLP